VKVVLQRVRRASVTVEGRVAGEIQRGLLLLVGFTGGDDLAAVSWMAAKIRGLRIFAGDDGKMDRSVEEVEGEVLVVSQFTLYGDVSRGRRPSFIDAASPEAAVPLYEAFIEALRVGGSSVQTGHFGALMQVELVNDGPVTLILER
jgi:D-tyrosyl-tRNA(Tyr) deacylase